MGVKVGNRVGPAVGLAVVLVVGAGSVLWAQAQVPLWLRDWVRAGGTLLTLAAAAVLARRFWPDPPPDHPPRRADPALPRPGVRSARRTLLGADGLFVLYLPVALTFDGFLPGWLRGAQRAGPEDGPVWFQALVFAGGAVACTGALVALGVQAVRLHRAVRRIAAGREPRWVATVLRNDPGALTLRLLPAGGGRGRVVRIANTVPAFAELDPGDELVLDGTPGRWEWVAVSGVGRTRWVNVTLWQPRAAAVRTGRPAAA